RPDFLDHLTRVGIEALYYDNSKRGYKFLNGRTTSTTNGVEKWFTLRRVGDHIITNLYNNLQWARSLPNNPELRRRVASAADAFLERMVEEGVILSFRPSVADSSNNTSQSIRKGVLNVRITYTPLIPADIIDVSIRRDVTELISIS
ncbi:MAG: phage tail sheath C-terminal domain-containing protein, partial [Halobacteria archaeon]